MQFAHYRLDKWLDSRELVIHLPSCIAPLRRLIAQNSQPHHIILIQFILPLLIAANSRCQPKPQECMRFQIRMEPWPSKSSQLSSFCLIAKYIFFSFKNKHSYHFLPINQFFHNSLLSTTTSTTNILSVSIDLSTMDIS